MASGHVLLCQQSILTKEVSKRLGLTPQMNIYLHSSTRTDSGLLKKQCVRLDEMLQEDRHTPVMWYGPGIDTIVAYNRPIIDREFMRCLTRSCENASTIQTVLEVVLYLKFGIKCELGF